MHEETRIVTTVVIRRPLECVFRFGSTPRNWPARHPTALAVTGAVDQPVQAGAEILEHDRFSFLKGCIRWRVRSATAPTGWVIDGVLDEVPLFRGTTTSITYTLTPADGGTFLERIMTYRTPNALARLLDRLYFKAHNARQSQRAVERMRHLLEQPGARGQRASRAASSRCAAEPSTSRDGSG
jgi:hypothetical protein